MDAVEIRQVRSFNRTVMTAIGALDHRFLGRARPMGEARLLWEVGEDGDEVRALRARLRLDSGYVSRLLRSLEGAGLVEVVTDDADRRVRRVRLTAAGQSERRILDERSVAQAARLLGSLEPRYQLELVDAMVRVERLLLRSSVSITEVAAGSQEVRRCFERYFAELDARFEGGFDVRRSNRLDVADLVPPSGLVLLARAGSEAVGCGAVRLHADGVAEVKRMWVAPRMRGTGLGRRLLEALEGRGRAAGARVARLETNRALTDAIAMYHRAGYHEVPPFNTEPYAHHWFQKDLTVNEPT